MPQPARGPRWGARSRIDRVEGVALRRAACRLAAACSAVVMPAASANAAPPGATPIEASQKIQHVVMIMQENRSFDSYFGTYPGANGIPAHVCVPDPQHGGCVQPFHDPK